MLPMFHIRVCKPTTWAFLTAYLSIHPHVNLFRHLNSYYIFGQPFVKRFALCYQTAVCLSVLSVCNVGVLWPNGWMDQDETWHGGRPRPRPHCVRWGPSSPPQRGHSPPIFGTSVPHVCCGQTAGWINMPLGTEVVDLCPGDIVRWAHPQKGGTVSPTFRPMSMVAKRSPISATAELLLCLVFEFIFFTSACSKSVTVNK